MSGSDDHSVLVWDKQTTQLLEELNGHDGPVFLFKIILVCSTTDIICDVNCLLFIDIPNGESKLNSDSQPIV